MSRLGCVGQLVLVLVVGGLATAGLIALLNPWALHMGGRPTLLLTWRGFGTLHTKAGDYPLYLYFSPATHRSVLRMEGRLASGGLTGSGCLCTSPIQYLKLSGDIYGSWKSTEGSIVSFGLSDRRTAHDTLVGNMKGGYLGLIGGWRGQDLILSERGTWSSTFRSGLRIVGASVTLHPSDSWTCNTACAAAHQGS